MSSVTYVVPIAANRSVADDEFTAYLENVAAWAELVIVDGSPPDVFAQHHGRWGELGQHVAPRVPSLMGKVGGVMTGVLVAAHERVVIADDDVRYGAAELAALAGRLDAADVVRPQNYFDPLPWHAVWDSGRMLLNRATGGDWPGTLAVRRSTLLGAGGYSGDVMFENYELVKTVEAAGGRQQVAADIFVRRLPPSTAHFWSQRVRQAYDELARPPRLAAFLAVVPLVLVQAARGRWRTLGGATVVAASCLVGAAEVGRRREGAAAVFPFRCSLGAPVWVAERSICAWAAVAARLRGGVRYRGSRIRLAALPANVRRQRVATAQRAA